MLADKLEIIPLPLNFSVLNSQQIYPTPSDKFSTPPNSLISNLSFSHIVELLTVEDPIIVCYAYCRIYLSILLAL